MISCNTYRDKSYNQTYGIQVFSLFIISPLLSLIFIVNGMRQNIRTAYFMFALFLSLLAYMLAPISDLASYGYLYYEYQNMSWPQFVTYQLQGEDFIMQITEWLFAQCRNTIRIYEISTNIISFRFTEFYLFLQNRSQR